MPDDRLIQLKDRAAAQFLSVPGVTVVGLGGRERGGRPTGEVVLEVFVERERPVARPLTDPAQVPGRHEALQQVTHQCPSHAVLDGRLIH